MLNNLCIFQRFQNILRSEIRVSHCITKRSSRWPGDFWKGTARRAPRRYWRPRVCWWSPPYGGSGTTPSPAWKNSSTDWENPSRCRRSWGVETKEVHAEQHGAIRWCMDDGVCPFRLRRIKNCSIQLRIDVHFGTAGYTCCSGRAQFQGGDRRDVH